MKPDKVKYEIRRGSWWGSQNPAYLMLLGGGSGEGWRTGPLQSGRVGVRLVEDLGDSRPVFRGSPFHTVPSLVRRKNKTRRVSADVPWIGVRLVEVEP